MLRLETQYQSEKSDLCWKRSKKGHGLHKGRHYLNRKKSQTKL